MDFEYCAVDGTGCEDKSYVVTSAEQLCHPQAINGTRKMRVATSRDVMLVNRSMALAQCRQLRLYSFSLR
jgi:hypothetical protein